MNILKPKSLKLCTGLTMLSIAVYSIANEATSKSEHVSDEVLQDQRNALTHSVKGKGYGPQSPRDIDSDTGVNTVSFTTAPPFNEMNLCDIHFHKNAEHKGGQFTEYAGNGNGEGYQSGYRFSGTLTAEETKNTGQQYCPSEHSVLYPGDTIEVHYVYTTAPAKPAPTLKSCFTEAVVNPQLRVESQVFVVVNSDDAMDFGALTNIEFKNGLHQVPELPDNTGIPVEYAGSTTGPGFNKKGSPYQVTWNVRPNVAKVNIDTVDKWCKGNVFEENHAHGVRNLVISPEILSKIGS